MSFITSIVFFLVIALGFYAFLSLGAAQSLTETFGRPPSPTWTSGAPEPTRTPIPTPVFAPTSTPNPPDIPDRRDDRVGAETLNRADCGEIRGTRYRSPEERSWYLTNCTATPNRADCDAIRGTQYLSTAERRWYLAFCT